MAVVSDRLLFCDCSSLVSSGVWRNGVGFFLSGFFLFLLLCWGIVSIQAGGKKTRIMKGEKEWRRGGILSAVNCVVDSI